MGFSLGVGKFSPSSNSLIIKQSNIYVVELQISETDTTGYWEISQVNSMLILGENNLNTWGITAKIVDSGRDFCKVQIDATNVQFTQKFYDHLNFKLWTTIEGSQDEDAYEYNYYFTVASLENGELPDIPNLPDLPIAPDLPEDIVRVGNITAFPNSIYFPATGGSVGMLLVSDVEVEQWEYAVDSRIKITTNSQSRNEWDITLTMEQGNLDNPNSIFTTLDIYAYYDTEHTIYDEITPLVTIGGNQIVPIWKDTFCSFPEQYDSIRYTIESSSEIIYSGKATKYPSEQNVKINVNRVVKDYLNNHYNAFDGNTYPTALGNFIKEVSIKGDGKVFATYTFYNSWSYENYLPPILSKPIRNVLDNRQYFMCSIYSNSFNNGDYSYRVIDADGK